MSIGHAILQIEGLETKSTAPLTPVYHYEAKRKLKTPVIKLEQFVLPRIIVVGEFLHISTNLLDTNLADTLPVNEIGPQWWIMHSFPPPPPLFNFFVVYFEPKIFLKIKYISYSLFTL